MHISFNLNLVYIEPLKVYRKFGRLPWSADGANVKT